MLVAWNMDGYGSCPIGIGAASVLVDEVVVVALVVSGTVVVAAAASAVAATITVGSMDEDDVDDGDSLSGVVAVAVGDVDVLGGTQRIFSDSANAFSFRWFSGNNGRELVE